MFRKMMTAVTVSTDKLCKTVWSVNAVIIGLFLFILL